MQKANRSWCCCCCCVNQNLDAGKMNSLGTGCVQKGHADTMEVAFCSRLMFFRKDLQQQQQQQQQGSHDDV
jgi:hypothetical protein